MFEYELHQYRIADLVRRAAHERLAREALAGRRSRRRAADPRATGAESHTPRFRRHWFTPAA
ncbi:hypothetical protein ACFYOV_30850 [Streptomyces sp. NPDC005931]|uniref:hypothetical protein n=1 Tax=Streptomyces sp. NPDC005931 TaxID=3364737 RepID=UPI0036C06821